ncbi:MAG TPA: cysteine--tRNA ligase, partial [Chlamydiales bacterium]|nr:cysteine--tRNA ligase [Chlamydiales bacterium]
MKEIRLYNSETRQKELAIFEKKGVVRIYICGPTIYDFAHIGNFRTYLFEDLLRRTLKFFGYQVIETMNITDVDDKTIRGATEKKVKLKEFTDPFRKAFFEDLKTLHIEPVEHYLDATDYIPEMIRLIEILLEKGVAYQSPNGSVYFNIRQFPSYGRLAHLQLEPEKSIEGHEADEYGKENVSDFVLWKAYDPERDGVIYWESPFGKGRPGWHIECSAMAMKSLGETIDIHCGGIDNLFPHHENEIAQSECCTGKRFVRYWLHSEHLLVNHQKMSKSLGNFYTLRDLLKKGYQGMEVRFHLLSSHYRTQLNFTFQGMDAARASLARMKAFALRLQEISQGSVDESRGVDEALKRADLAFQESLADDLNISAALGAVFDLIREVNVLADEGKVGREGAIATLSKWGEWNQVLGFLPQGQREEAIPEELSQLLQEREEARKSRNFSLSDQLRETIEEKGYLVEDTPSGARLKKK